MYGLNSLEDVCTSLFYDYMADTVEGNKALTHADQKYFEHSANIIGMQEEIEDLNKYNIFQDRVKYLRNQIKVLKSLNKNKQKRLYSTNKTCEYSTIVNIPLTYKLHKTHLPFPSTEFELEVVFYDDVTTLSGRYEEYKALRTFKSRKQFVKDNTKITHMSIVYNDGGSVTMVIPVAGKVDCEKLRECGVVQLDRTFLSLKRKTVDDILAVSGDTNRHARDTLLEMYFKQGEVVSF